MEAFRSAAADNPDEAPVKPAAIAGNVVFAGIVAVPLLNVGEPDVAICGGSVPNDPGDGAAIGPAAIPVV